MPTGSIAKVFYSPLLATPFPTAGISAAHVRADQLLNGSLAAKWARLLITYLTAANLSGGRGDLLQDLQKDGLDAEGDWGACIGRGRQEVGEAGHDADVGLATNGLETLGEDGKTAARNDLASGHQGTIAAVRRVHVTFHIRVAENREAPQRGHGGNRMKTQRGDSRQSDSGSQIFCINAM